MYAFAAGPRVSGLHDSSRRVAAPQGRQAPRQAAVHAVRADIPADDLVPVKRRRSELVSEHLEHAAAIILLCHHPIVIATTLFCSFDHRWLVDCLLYLIRFSGGRGRSQTRHFRQSRDPDSSINGDDPASRVTFGDADMAGRDGTGGAVGPLRSGLPTRIRSDCCTRVRRRSVFLRFLLCDGVSQLQDLFQRLYLQLRVVARHVPQYLSQRLRVLCCSLPSTLLH